MFYWILLINRKKRVVASSQSTQRQRQKEKKKELEVQFIYEARRRCALLKRAIEWVAHLMRVLLKGQQERGIFFFFFFFHIGDLCRLFSYGAIHLEIYLFQANQKGKKSF